MPELFFTLQEIIQIFLKTITFWMHDVTIYSPLLECCINPTKEGGNETGLIDNIDS